MKDIEKKIRADIEADVEKIKKDPEPTTEDMYEDIAGTAEVESVVHMFNTETGFTSHVTPDCILAIDNKYETTTGWLSF